jgi:hypothetical protein
MLIQIDCYLHLPVRIITQCNFTRRETAEFDEV